MVRDGLERDGRELLVSGGDEELDHERVTLDGHDREAAVVLVVEGGVRAADGLALLGVHEHACAVRDLVGLEVEAHAIPASQRAAPLHW
eukprot:COSAG01_NODE_373_length_17991_cov_284.890075_8_plen_89_part_00